MIVVGAAPEETPVDDKHCIVVLPRDRPHIQVRTIGTCGGGDFTAGILCGWRLVLACIFAVRAIYGRKTDALDSVLVTNERSGSILQQHQPAEQAHCLTHYSMKTNNRFVRLYPSMFVRHHCQLLGLNLLVSTTFSPIHPRSICLHK